MSVASFAKARSGSLKNKGNRYKGRVQRTEVDFSGASAWLVFLSKALLGALVLMTISFAFLAAYRYVTTMEAFSLEKIEVHGTRHLDPEDVVAASGVLVGQNILGLNIAEKQALLSGHPWIRNVVVKRELPDSLTFTVEEKEASFWVSDGGRLNYAEKNGLVIAPVEPKKLVALPILKVEKNAEAALPRLVALVNRLDGQGLPFGLADIGWVVVAKDFSVKMQMQRRPLLLTLSLMQFEENVTAVNMAWRDLERRGELSAVRSISAFRGKACVEMAVGEPSTTKVHS